MRKIRRKQEMQKRIIIISTICLFLCLCVGYAAFQTNISITAKGNVVCAGEDAADKILEDSLVTSGSGIYVDSYENDRYVYRGSDVNNYITFNDEPWRIIAIESDGTLKIMRNDSIGLIAYDESGNRDEAGGWVGGTYCYYTMHEQVADGGCNVWSSTANMVNSPAEFVFADVSGTVLLDSTLNTYLNGTYYNDYLLEEAKELIVDYIYNIGGVTYNNANSTSYTISNQLADESEYQWKGKVALITLSDYVRANSNDNNYCNIVYGSLNNSSTCRETDWMSFILTITQNGWWTLTPNTTSANRNTRTTVWAIGYNGSPSGLSFICSATSYVLPVVHLKANLHLTGSGTENDPYEIVDCN